VTPQPTPLRTRLWRAALIAAIAGGVLAFGVRYAPARLRPGGPPTWAGAGRVQAEVALEPLPGSQLLRSHEVVLNGERTQFAQYRSGRPAREVIAQFEARYGSVSESDPAAQGSMVRVAAGGYAMVGAVDEGRRSLGLVAFDDPKAGGSFYFVGRGDLRPSAAPPEGDVPGHEVPGIPRPLRSRRVLCLDGLGGIPSRLLVYEGWGDIADTVQLFTTELPQAGWTRNADVERVIQQRLPGTFLSFLKGTHRAMVYIEREADTNKVRTAVTYAVKDWLPPDRGL
jgi:hypothetical protein